MANELEKNTENTQDTEPEKENKDTASADRIKQLESEIARLKNAVTNASADASKYKKQYQELLPEKERLEKEQEEANAALQKELADLKAERNIANFKSQYISIGFDDESAAEAAQALNAGDTDKVFTVLRKFIATHDKQLKENAFRSNPTLSGGDVPKAVTREQFEKMGYTERLEVFNNHPDLYKEFTS